MYDIATHANVEKTANSQVHLDARSDYSSSATLLSMWIETHFFFHGNVHWNTPVETHTWKASLRLKSINHWCKLQVLQQCHWADLIAVRSQSQKWLRSHDCTAVLWKVTKLVWMLNTVMLICISWRGIDGEDDKVWVLIFPVAWACWLAQLCC